MISYRLFIDDERWPPSDGTWIIVRNTTEAIRLLGLISYGPSFISFDHDLGGDDTGMEFAKWLTNFDMDRGGKFLPPDFDFYVHSRNPPGAENIDSFMRQYLERGKP